MTLQVPYLADEAIERDAEALLAQFAHARGMAIRAPIPIEDIIEKHLKLRVEFDDLHRLFGVPRNGFGVGKIFGAIWLETGQIYIDESLDPEEHPSIEEFYRFTLAHEGGGHWRLHRFLANTARGSLFTDAQQPTVVCRTSQAKERVEFQANLYASSLLMPRKLVMQAWCQRFGNDHPGVLRRQDRIVVPGDTEDEILVRAAFDRMRAAEAARRLAAQFFVSPTAMRIRLERLGLLHREGLKTRIVARPALFF